MTVPAAFILRRPNVVCGGEVQFPVGFSLVALRPIRNLFHGQLLHTLLRICARLSTRSFALLLPAPRSTLHARAVGPVAISLTKKAERSGAAYFRRSQVAGELGCVRRTSSRHAKYRKNERVAL
jgi:hypothetical protein